ncbi:hypothetical protein BGZ95_008839 [Linnemannia exigua]|uniref:Uncharacterized protein n=1 Tax=Linnemannia exigua TaxID=604196 RepID=A0AAD4H898_9FUNG|nr:hypothetical protein BGZ95_008839 [Linnemannia exigua]
MSLPLLVACTSVIWALSVAWTSAPTSLTSALSTLAMCSSALFYLYYHTRRRSSSSSPAGKSTLPWAWMWGLPLSTSTTATTAGAGQETRQQQQPARFITLDFHSSPSFTTAPQSTGERAYEHSSGNNTDNSSQELLSPSTEASTTERTARTAHASTGAETTGVTSAQLRAAGLSALGTVSSETLDALRMHPDDRIWDHIIVGGM